MSPVLATLFVVALFGGTLGALIWARLGIVGRVNYIGLIVLIAIITSMAAQFYQ